MLANVICLLAGVLITTLIFTLLNRAPAMGELEIDDEKEILQIVFYSRESLAKTIGKKKSASFKVTHKALDWQVPQEKHGI